MNKKLWGAQVLLAVLFLLAGGMKIVTPAADMAAQATWVEHVPPWAPKVIGVLEVAGAIGLVAPAATGIMPVLTPAAAAGLALTMAGASVLHIRLGEYANLVPPLVLLALCLFVARGRLKTHPLGRGATGEPPASEIS